MGLFEEDSEEEVKISPGDGSGSLEKEVEEQIKDRKTRGQEISERSRSSGSNSFSKDVSLEDIHEQNKRIIELLEDLNSSESGSSEDQGMEGDLNGVL